MANAFSVERTMQDGLVVLSLDGFLDAHTAPQFEAAIQKEMDAGQVRMVVDCRKLTYISSAGLGVFMTFVEELREQGGDIKICGVIPKVLSVFEVLGFPELFDIVDDVPQAVQRFAEAPTRES